MIKIEALAALVQRFAGTGGEELQWVETAKNDGGIYAASLWSGREGPALVAYDLANVPDDIEIARWERPQ